MSVEALIFVSSVRLTAVAVVYIGLSSQSETIHSGEYQYGCLHFIQRKDVNVFMHHQHLCDNGGGYNDIHISIIIAK